MKICNRCKIPKDNDSFYKIKKGKSLHSNCKECCAIKNSINQKSRDKEKKKVYNDQYNSYKHSK